MGAWMSLGRVVGGVALLSSFAAATGSAQGGLGLTVSAGIARSLAELANPRPDIGWSFEIQPEWRSRGGFGLGVGFRHTTYADVPDRDAVYFEVRYTEPREGLRPSIALRGGGFHGGDTQGDDPYIGLEIGPIGGLEAPLSRSAAIRVEAYAWGVLALFRGARVLPGVQVGLVLR